MSQRSIPSEIHCRHCGNTIDRNLPICRHCGVRNQYAQQNRDTGGSRSASFAPDYDLASVSQVWAGVKSSLYASITGIVATTLLFLLSLGDIFWQIPDVIRNIPAVSAAVAGGAALESVPVAIAKFFVWVFFGANFVGVSSTATAGEASREMTSNVVVEIGSVTTLNPLLFHGVVLALLVIAGYRASASTGYDEVYEDAAAGATVGIGYGIVGALGAMFAAISFGGGYGPTASVGPSLPLAVLVFAGLGAVCGSIGGLVRWTRETDF